MPRQGVGVADLAGLVNRPVSLRMTHAPIGFRHAGDFRDSRTVPTYNRGCRMHRRTTLLTAAGLALLLGGCNWLVPLAFVGEHKKKIAPEFDKLPGKRVAILVWAAPETLFDYPFARLELATHLGDKLAEDLATRKQSIDLVDSRDVEDYLGREPEARLDPRMVGRRFDCDYVIYIEVLEFQMRDAARPQFLQGRIYASVAVHDIRAEADRTRAFELAPVTAMYPNTGPVLMSATNSLLVREQTYRLFAELAARKFYEYTVDL